MNLREEENYILKEWEELLSKDEIFAKDGAGENYQASKVKILFLAKETNATWNTREYLDEGVFYRKTQYSKSKKGKYEHVDGTGKYIESDDGKSEHVEGTGDYKKSRNGNYRKEHTKGSPIGKTFNNIFRWANYFFHQEMTFKEFKKVPKSRRKNIFSRVAMMNLKKTPGSASTVSEELKEAIIKYKKNIKKQLNLYTHSNEEDTNIIICCGKGVFSGLKTVIEPDNLSNIKDNGEFITAEFDNTIIMDFYHPQVRGVSIERMYELLKKNKAYIDYKNKYINS